MADLFLGQLLLVPFNFPPKGTAFCNGQILPISQNTALFSLLGTQYGGNGTSTFALPNLQGLTAIHQGQGSGLSQYVMGQTGGSAAVTLITSQIPSHTHTHQGTTVAATSSSPGGALFAEGGGRGHAVPFYVAAPGPGTTAVMNAAALSTAGSSQSHNNLMPYLTLTYVIALQGIFPSRN